MLHLIKAVLINIVILTMALMSLECGKSCSYWLCGPCPVSYCISHLHVYFGRKVMLTGFKRDIWLINAFSKPWIADRKCYAKSSQHISLVLHQTLSSVSHKIIIMIQLFMNIPIHLFSQGERKTEGCFETEITLLRLSDQEFISISQKTLFFYLPITKVLLLAEPNHDSAQDADALICVKVLHLCETYWLCSASLIWKYQAIMMLFIRT